MFRFALSTAAAVGLLFASADLNQAQAQYGYRSCGVPAYSAGFGHRSIAPVGVYSVGRASGLAVSRSSLYGSPFHGSFYGGRSAVVVPGPRVSSFGVGGFGNVGFGNAGFGNAGFGNLGYPGSFNRGGFGGVPFGRGPGFGPGVSLRIGF